jgi:hypothetical protein
MRSCWKVLGIEATKEKRVIKKAYSELVKKYHPEEFPNEYKEVRNAYEQAIMYTKITSHRVPLVSQFEKRKEVIEDKKEEHYNQETMFDNLDDTLWDNTPQKEIDTPLKEDEEYKLFLEIQIQIDQKIQQIIDKTLEKYNSLNANDITIWKEWFEDNIDNSELIIETLLDTGLSNIHNEVVTQYLEDVIKELPYDNKKIYKQRIYTLRKKTLLIEEQEIALYKRLLGYFLMVFNILSFLLMLPISIIYIYRLTSTDETLRIIGLILLLVFTMRQATRILNRIITRSETLFYRSLYFIIVGMLSALCNSVFIIVSYQYIQTEMLSTSLLLTTVLLNSIIFIIRHTKRYKDFIT